MECEWCADIEDCEYYFCWDCQACSICEALIGTCLCDTTDYSFPIMIELVPLDQSKPKRVVSLDRAIELYKKGDFQYETIYSTDLFFMDLPIDVAEIQPDENTIFFIHPDSCSMRKELESMIGQKLFNIKGLDKWKLDYNLNIIKVVDTKYWKDEKQNVTVCVRANFDIKTEIVNVTLNA